MGETEHPSCLWFRDFWTCPWAPKTNIIYLWRHQDTVASPRKSQILFTNIIFVNIKISEIDNLGKDGRRTFPTTRLINSWKYWKWDQYLPENMKWNFGNMGSLKLWKLSNQETKARWSQETKKPRQTRNQETSIFSYPSTYRLPPLYQTTLLGDTGEVGGHEWSGLGNRPRYWSSVAPSSNSSRPGAHIQHCLGSTRKRN